MKNLKKTLAVVLAFVMVLSMGAISTFAYTDVAAGTITDEAVSILSGLNILTGFEDGTFRPEETVTRAQMAAIICRTLGYESQAESSKGFTVFNDVAADHWASGYINVAQAQGIINGYGDGNFGPEDKVTYEQAVKMIVSALGYDLPAAQKGGYPTGYLAIASAQGITKNANGRVGDAAARATIAVLVYNSLEVNLFEQNSWSTDGGDSYAGVADNVLTRYLDIKKIEATVAETPLTEVSGTESTYNVDDKAFVDFEDVKAWDYTDKKFVSADAEDIEDINVAFVDDVNAFLGKRVIAYIGEYADSETGDKMLYAIAEKNGTNKTVKVNAIQLVDNATEDKLVYKNNGKKVELDLALTDVYVNYATMTLSDLKEEDGSNTTELATEDFVALLATGGIVELIDSDSANDGYECAIITRYDEQGVVEEVEADDMDILFKTYAGGVLGDIDLEAEDELVIVYKDGEVADVNAIAEGDTVTTANITDDEKVRILFVSSKTVTGAVDGWTATELEIAGEYYTPSLFGPSLSSLQEMEGVFYLNVDGQIAYADGTAAKGDYGFILNVYSEGTGERAKYYATIVDADGNVAEYEFKKENAKFTGEADWDAEEDEFVTDELTGLNDEEIAAYVAAIMDSTDGNEDDETDNTYTADDAYAHVNTANRLLFEVKIKNEKIAELVQVVGAAPAQGKYNADKNALGSKKFDENTVMFALSGEYDDTDLINEEDIKVGSIADFLADEEEYYVSLSTDARTGQIYNAAIGYSLTTSIPFDAELIVVTSVGTRSYNDDVATVITGLQAGEEVSFKIYNEDGYTSAGGFDPANIVAGDIIATNEINAEGIATDFAVIYDRSEGDVASDNAGKDLYYLVSDYNETPEASNDFIWLDTSKANVTTTESGVHFVAFDSAANYVLVDESEVESASDEPVISKKSASKSIFGNLTRYDSEVFVRVIDGELIDVVVYRTV